MKGPDCAYAHLHGFHLQVFLGDFWRGWWLVAVLGRMMRAWGWIRLTAKLTKFSLYLFYSSIQSKQNEIWHKYLKINQ